MDSSIQQMFSEIHLLIRQAKEKAFHAVNTELISLYWKVGKFVHEKVKISEWGKGIITQLADYIQTNEPDIKGFSSQNIWRMKQFYETYNQFPKLSALLREISWKNI